MAGSLRVEERDGALWLTLDRPPLNILDIPAFRAPDAALRPLAGRRDKT